MNTFKLIGKREPKIDSNEKITGSAKFVDDINFSRILYGAILRSPFAHARIKKIDISKAKNIDGVRAVITADDTALIKYIHMGEPRSDKFPLQKDIVRYIGDEIAAVAAIDKETAIEALKLIDVDFEELPSYFDPEESIKDGAYQIHEGRDNNIGAKIHWKFGDVEKGFMEADLVLEDRFTTPAQSHCIIEPHGTIASFEDGKLTVWTSTQSPYFIRKELSKILQLELSNVRIMETHGAGAFGARSKVCEDEAIAALLSRETGCPVKIILTREEEMCTTRIRHPYIIYLKSGFRKDGTLIARELRAIIDNGAYNHYGPAIMGYSGMTTCSHYNVANVKYDGYLVYTNKQYGGPYRGFGSPQATFAMESHMDEAAKKLELDPVTIRLLNMNKSGDTTVCGWQITSCGLKECIESVAEKVKWNEPRKPWQGKGISCSIHAAGGSRTFADGDYSSAIIHLNDQGSVHLFTGVSDTGTYITTVLCQIIGESLGIPMHKIKCTSMDTDTTPTDFGSWASKTAFLAGNAVILAVESLKKQLIESAAIILKEKSDNLHIVNGLIKHKEKDDFSIEFGEAVSKSKSKIGRILIGSGHYESPTEMLNRETGFANISAAYSFAAHAVEVEIDPETGLLNIKRIIAAHDVGRALNLNAVEGQIEGAVAQGIGFALYEEQIYKDGRVLTNHLRDHRPVTFLDIPPIETIIVETNDPNGPFGAKGIAEIGTVSVAAAVASAVYDATGIRITELPIKPEKLMESIERARNNSANK